MTYFFSLCSPSVTLLEILSLKLFVLSYGFGYVLGSLPFGLILTRWSSHVDLRQTGSGNIGATNVLRSGSPLLAFWTLLLDFGKGSIAVLGIKYIYGLEMSPAYQYVAGASVVIGHMFPLWLKFKGGKGVATLGGALFVLSWPVWGLTIATWGIVAIMTRYSSVAGVVSAVLGPCYGWILGDECVSFWFAGLSLLIILKHRTNLWRLWHGKETKIVFHTTHPPNAPL